MKVTYNRIFGAIIITVVLLFCKNSFAQLNPANKSSIYYTQIMFEYPLVKDKAYYQLSVSTASGTAFNSKVVYSATDSSSAHLASKIFGFGRKYYWQYAAFNSEGNRIFNSPEYCFYTKKNKLVDSTQYQTNITWYQPENCLDGLISGDNNVLYTRKGEPVFFLDGMSTLCRDFKVNFDGNFTCLDTTRLFEIDINNKRLWASPEIDSPNYEIKNYHHGIVKLRNGNFLCMAKKVSKEKNNTLPISVILEFNYQNKMVWSWFEDDHYILDTNMFKGSHMNSIFVDSNDFLLVSNRDLNSIIKIDRKTGEVIYSIGYDMGNAIPFIDNNDFAGQHHVTKLENGNILMFNNSLGVAPLANTSILEIEEPNGREGLSAVWSYVFNFDNKVFNYVPRMGGVIQLPNGNFLIGTGVFNRIFEINRAGEFIWESNLKRKDSVSGLFNPVPVFRAHYMSSLYPSWFTVELLKNRKSIRITNEGTEDDSYSIQVMNGLKKLKMYSTISVKKESTLELPISGLQKDDSILITPISNPKKRRTVLF